MSNRRIKRVQSVLSSRGAWHVLWPVWTICGVLLSFGVFVVVRQYLMELPKKSDIPVVAVSDARNLHMETSKLSSGQLHLFEISTSGEKVTLAVQRAGDGTVHVALASCRACYRNRDHHYAEKGKMMCGKCGGPMNFESKHEKPDTNSCALVEIPHRETNGDVAVLTRDVIAQVGKLPH